MQAYPLAWPPGWPRTPFQISPRDRFGSPTIARARDRLLNNLKLLGAKNAVVSTNLELRRDGLPLSQQRAISDHGVAVYFQRGDRALVMACDRWSRVEANLTSLSLAIEGLRQMERHGSAHMMERAFEGFAALPPPRTWRDVLGLNGGATPADVDRAYRDRARKAHPDAGGSNAAMAELNRARDDALAELRS